MRCKRVKCKLATDTPTVASRKSREDRNQTCTVDRVDFSLGASRKIAETNGLCCWNRSRINWAFLTQSVGIVVIHREYTHGTTEQQQIWNQERRVSVCMERDSVKANGISQRTVHQDGRCHLWPMWGSSLPLAGHLCSNPSVKRFQKGRSWFNFNYDPEHVSFIPQLLCLSQSFLTQYYFLNLHISTYILSTFHGVKTRGLEPLLVHWNQLPTSDFSEATKNQTNLSSFRVVPERGRKQVPH